VKEKKSMLLLNSFTNILVKKKKSS